MSHFDDTQPKRPQSDTQLPPRVPPPDYYEAEVANGPGCLAWGFVGVMSVFLAVAIVIVATLTAFSEGVEIGRGNATATRQANIAAQCAVMPTDVAAERGSLLQTRFDDLGRDGLLPACAMTFVPQATQIFIDNQATATPTATQTPTATMTSAPNLPTSTPTIAATAADVESASTGGQFDPAQLLLEAQQLIGSSNYLDAVTTLDAIIAIDPTFQTGTVNQLLFNALTAEAERLFRTGGSLSEAIILAERARDYGDIGDLGGEIYAAELYLNAQPHIGINYPQAINWLTQLTALYPNYRDARQQLIQQYEGYGDAFAAGLEFCQAVQQYDNALNFAQAPAVVTKRDQAQTQCNGLAPATGGTPDPNAPPTQAVAPIGQPGT